MAFISFRMFIIISLYKIHFSIFNLARLCVKQIILWIIVLPSYLIITFYDLFCHLYMSPVSHMKWGSVARLVWYSNVKNYSGSWTHYCLGVALPFHSLYIFHTNQPSCWFTLTILQVDHTNEPHIQPIQTLHPLKQQLVRYFQSSFNCINKFVKCNGTNSLSKSHVMNDGQK